MRFLFSLLAVFVAVAQPALADDSIPAPKAGPEVLSIPGGNVYFGVSATAVMLPIGMTFQDGIGFVRTGSPDGGVLLGLALTVELERLLFLGSAEIGVAGYDGVLVRGTVLAGYTLTPNSTAPYLALGLSAFSISYGDGEFGNEREADQGIGAVLEGGVLIGRSRRFGRITAAATVMLPLDAGGRTGAWDPWLGLAVRFQL